jgi:hypothetical protein
METFGLSVWYIDFSFDYPVFLVSCYIENALLFLNYFLLPAGLCPLAFAPYNFNEDTICLTKLAQLKKSSTY